MTFNLMIAGVGGQGTVLASRLIAAAAMKENYSVRTTETIGMAQRGGCVFGHVRIGDNIFSPLVPMGKADAIIAFEPAEAVRQLPYLGEQGRLIVCDYAISPASTGGYDAAAIIDYLKANIKNITVVDGLRIIKHNAKTLNVAMLGAAVQNGIFPFNAGSLIEAIKEIFPQKFLEMNLKAFELGRQEKI